MDVGEVVLHGCQHPCGHKRVSDSLKLEFQALWQLSAGDGNPAWVLWKIKNCGPLSHPYVLEAMSELCIEAAAPSVQAAITKSLDWAVMNNRNLWLTVLEHKGGTGVGRWNVSLWGPPPRSEVVLFSHDVREKTGSWDLNVNFEEWKIFRLFFMKEKI